MICSFVVTSCKTSLDEKNFPFFWSSLCVGSCLSQACQVLHQNQFSSPASLLKVAPPYIKAGLNFQNGLETILIFLPKQCSLMDNHANSSYDNIPNRRHFLLFVTWFPRPDDNGSNDDRYHEIQSHPLVVIHSVWQEQ